jgi:hypothetical protein
MPALYNFNFLIKMVLTQAPHPLHGDDYKVKKNMSRRVSLSFTLSFAELKIILSIFCVTLRFISEPLRESKNYFLVSPDGG